MTCFVRSNELYLFNQYIPYMCAYYVQTRISELNTGPECIILCYYICRIDRSHPAELTNEPPNPTLP